MTKALYRKWRPQNWDEVAAQEHVIQTLRNAVINDRVAHAYLFAGPRGTGKTTTARLLAKAVNCLEPELKKRPCNQCEHCLAINAGRFMDLIEIDAASNTSVDDVRDLREKINFSPSQGAFKVYIIDEVHMLSTAAFNALLKTLEEPPPHAIFILATTEIHKIPSTVLSRCQRHEFRRIPLNIIVDYLKKQSDQEGFQVAEPVFAEIARQATGSLRDAISLLDQLSSTEEMITLEMAQNVMGTATDLRVIELVEALLAKDAGKGLHLIHQALDSGADPRQFARQIVTYLRNVLLDKMGNGDQIDLPRETRAKVNAHSNQFSLPELLRAIEAFNTAISKEHANWHPGLGLELAFTAYLAEPEISSAPLQEEDSKNEPRRKPSTRKPEATQTSESKPKPEPDEEQNMQVEEKAQIPVSKKTQEMSESDLPEEDSEQKGEKASAKDLEIEKSPLQESDEVAFEQIQRSWTEVKARVGQHNKGTEAVLNSCKLLGMKGENTLILGFASDTVKGFMEKEGNLNLTCDILEEVFKKPLLIQCIVSNQQRNTLPSDVAIDQDGMVSTATRDLGGKISRAEEAD